jgi:hypothetical protein
VHRSIGKTGEEFSTEIGEQRLNPLILLRETLNAFELLRSYWKKKFMDVKKRMDLRARMSSHAYGRGLIPMKLRIL